VEIEDFELSREKRIQLLNSWYNQCSDTSLVSLPDTDEAVYKNELNLQNKKNMVLDETVYSTELKLEDKKSLLDDEVLKPKNKSFHRRRKEAIRKKAFERKVKIIIVEEVKKEKKKKENPTLNCFQFGTPDIARILLGVLILMVTDQVQRKLISVICSTIQT
jgi:hypothetical protein